ncbi:hypothetical protein WAI453_010109 [Rhynchosporium graminicola]
MHFTALFKALGEAIIFYFKADSKTIDVLEKRRNSSRVSVVNGTSGKGKRSLTTVAVSTRMVTESVDAKSDES